MGRAFATLHRCLLALILCLIVLPAGAHICDEPGCEPGHEDALPDCPYLPPGAEFDCKTPRRPKITPLPQSPAKPETALSAFSAGAIFVCRSFELLLPLLALGIGAGMSGLRSLWSVPFFLAGIGGALTGVTAPFLMAHSGFVSPALLSSGSILLLAPRRFLPWLLAAASLLIGHLIAFLVIMHGQAGATSPAFGAGVLLAASVIPVIAAGLWARFERPWLIVAARILGSWQLAITLLLFGLATRTAGQ